MPVQTEIRIAGDTIEVRQGKNGLTKAPLSQVIARPRNGVVRVHTMRSPVLLLTLSGLQVMAPSAAPIVTFTSAMVVPPGRALCAAVLGRWPDDVLPPDVP